MIHRIKTAALIAAIGVLTVGSAYLIIRYGTFQDYGFPPKL